MAVGLVTLMLTVSVCADEKGERVGLMFEGHFEKVDIASKVEGAKKIQLAAAYEWKYGVRLFTDASWALRGLDWETFSLKAARVADEIASGLKPQYIRDPRGVISYAIVESEDPFLGSAVTSPNFLPVFADTMGDVIHVVIVDRHVLYVFPSTGNALAEFGPALVEIFQRTAMPVSLEVLQIEKGGYRVIGEIEKADAGN